MKSMLPMPANNWWVMQPAEIGMRDGFGFDDFSFWLGVVATVLAALVAITTLGALVVRPIREANARERRDSERRDNLDRDLYGAPARPGRAAEPGLLEDVRLLKDNVARLSRDVERIAHALGVDDDMKEMPR